MKQLFLFFSIVISLSASAQSLDPVSLEQLVNTDIESNQYCPVIATDDQGNYMVFWTMNYYAGEIKARKFDSNHVAISDEITINTGNSKLMVAHYWEDGKFIVSYIENSGNNLKFTVINADNSLEAEVSVVSGVESFDVDIQEDTLAFIYNNEDNDQVYLRGYNLNNNAWINSQVLVTENSGADYSQANIVIHPDGSMTAIYHQYILVSGCCDYYRNIMRKTFSSSFLAEIPEETLWYVDSEYNVGSDLDAEGNANGEVMIVTTHGTVFSSRHMRLWILDEAGNFIVNNEQLVTSGDWYDNVECHLYDNGDFLVTKSIRNGGFSNPNSNEAYVIGGNNYNQNNTGLLQLNTTSSGTQNYVALAVFPNGGFVTAWDGNGFQGDEQGIYSRAFNAFAFPGLNTGSGGYEVDETGSSTSIPISLNTAPTGNVTVDISSTNTAEVTISPTTLTFTSNNWDTPQFVTALGVDDASDDGNVAVSLTLSTANSADGTYAGLADNSVSVMNLDDDATITAPGNQSLCQNENLSGVNAIITNNGGSITSVTATSSNAMVVDNSDISVDDIGGGQYAISINNLDNNTLGSTTISIQAQDENFTYTDSFDVEITGVEFTLNSEDMEICSGEEVTLSASGDASFVWDNGVENNVAFTPNETASYTLTASDDGECTASATVNITVNETADTPQITASSMEVCAGEEVTLTASGPSNISWDNGVSSGVAFIPAETSTYTAVGSNGNACTSSSSIEIVVNPLPDAPQISASSEAICEGSGVTLSGSGNVWLSWDNGVENNVEFFPTNTETYTLTAGDPDGCTITASINIVVNEIPAVPEITASSMEVCAGEAVTLTASGPTNITWEEGVENGVPFIPEFSSSYAVFGDEGNDCTSANSIEINVNALPSAPQILASEEEICSGTGITLLALGDGTLTWDNGVENNVEFFPSESSTYTVTSTNSDDCSASTSVDITVNPTPAVPTITLFNGSLVSSAMSGNQWYLDGEAIDGANNQTLENPSPGNYTVEVSNNGCGNISEAYVVLSTEEAFLSRANLYPNPAENVLNIKGLEIGTQFELTDMRGQIVRSSTFHASNASVDIADLASGVYLATFRYKDRVQHLRVVKE
jgi:hypothetical protein